MGLPPHKRLHGRGKRPGKGPGKGLGKGPDKGPGKDPGKGSGKSPGKGHSGPQGYRQGPGSRRRMHSFEAPRARIAEGFTVWSLRVPELTTVPQL